MEDATPQRLRQAAFARHLGVDRAYVTRLKHAGRLVIVDGLVDVAASLARIAQTTGTRDDVARRHADTRGADGETVETRAAAAGAAGDAANVQPQTANPAAPGATGAPPAANSPPPAANGGAGAPIAAADVLAVHPDADRASGSLFDAPAYVAPPGPPAPTALDRAREAKIVAESRRVQAAAAREELELARLRGAVIDREQVELAMRSVGASLGALLDVMAPQLAPLVAPVADLDECHAVIAQYGRDLRTRFAEACERQAKSLEAER